VHAEEPVPAEYLGLTGADLVVNPSLSSSSSSENWGPWHANNKENDANK
jgi:hypothetical protein